MGNPRKRHHRKHVTSHRRHRRNPARSGLPAISMSRPMNLLKPAAYGLSGFLAADMIPSMLGMTTGLMKLGVKAGVSLGGGMALSKFMGKQSALYFSVGAGINLLKDVVDTYIFKKTSVSISTAGLGAFPNQQQFNGPDMSGLSDSMGAFPNQQVEF